MTPRILVAGIGNDLLGDDGFGIAVVRALSATELPSGVELFEAGIGGISLVHELMDGYDALIVVDAIDRGGEPGRLWLLEVDVPDPRARPADGGAEVDMHLAVPERALILARAVGVLPGRVYLLGCQPHSSALGPGLSPEVQRAAERAVEQARSLVARLLERPVSAEDRIGGVVGAPLGAGV